MKDESVREVTFSRKLQRWVLRALESCGILLVYVFLFAVVLYVLLLGASHVYISGGAAKEVLGYKDAGSYWAEIETLDLPGLRDVGPIKVDQVTWYHGLRNAVFVICFAAIACLLPVIAVFLGVALLVVGIVEADWAAVAMAVLATPFVCVLAIPMAVIGALAVWVSLLIQPCTPIYAVIWIIFGLPFTALGMLGGGGGSYLLIAVFEVKK